MNRFEFSGLKYKISILVAITYLVPLVCIGNPFKTYTFGDRQKIQVAFSEQKIRIQLQPRKGDGVYRFASWTLRNWKQNFRKIEKYNKNKPLRIGRFVEFPYRALNSRIQGIALRALFSNDSSEANGWAHRVKYPGETISLISGVFAQSKITPNQLINYNKLSNQGRSLSIGDTVLIPWNWINSELNLQPYQVKSPLYNKGPLDKAFAYYRLRKGESLYSSVIVRFTGRTLADDVNALAKKILDINRIKNAHIIQVNMELKIPIEWISESFLIQDVLETEPAPGKKDVPEETQPDEVIETVQPQKEQPLYVILDAGHGGLDPGATKKIGKKKYIFEDETVYDISLRVKDLLKQKRINTYPILLDPNQEKPIARLAVKKDEDELILVHPRYNIRSAKAGINMRVYLINHLYQQLINQKKIPKSNIILISIHGDALHSALSGATVYYPDYRLRVPEFKKSNRVYRIRKEYQKSIRYYFKEGINNAKSSKKFGEKVIQSFRKNKLNVHKSFAVRGYYYRKGIRTLPAVLRYSKVPVSVLVEVGNLNNKNDRNKLLKDSFRQQVAKSIAESVEGYFNES
ncbi:MAG: LysM peptidoglycan-binding domain-containing protein [Deltaproteobacteria bacterium]|nr:LysM peptidoglycan-binding domain-containing protein [Deltaproteobacteria bacterium]MBT4526035.1 LysM peptidoglycan-binding domain-containing protein [Deltaproteobacteria bacterium]